MFPSELRADVDAAAPAGATHIGFVAIDPQRVLTVLYASGARPRFA